MNDLERDWDAASLQELRPGSDEFSLRLEIRDPGVHALAGRGRLALGGTERLVALIGYTTAQGDLSAFDTAADKARAVAARIGDDVEAEVRQSPEHAAEVAAQEKHDKATAEQSAVEQRLADAQAAYDQAVAERADPRKLRAAITKAETEMADVRVWVNGLWDDLLAARQQTAAVRRRAMRERCLQEMAVVRERRAALRQRAEQLVPGLIAELLAVHAIQQALTPK